MNKYLKIILAILPLLFFWVGINFHRGKYSNDPEYIYLINALAICDGKSVGHIDNPGTTVMQVGAVVMATTHFFYNPDNEPLVTHVLKDPDFFVEAIHTFLLVLNSIVILLLGFVGLKKTKSVWIALLLQASVFITSNTLDHMWTKVSPEPLLFFITSLYIIAILYFFADNNKNSWKYILFFSILTGAGLGTKATFLPLTIFPFIVLPGLKRKLLYVGGTVVSFVLFTVPAIPEYKSMYFWFRNLIGHSGIYGHGKEGIIDTSTYLPNIAKIIEKNTIFATATGIAFLIVLIGFIISRVNKIEKSNNWDIRILWGLSITSIFGILLVAKHYQVNHYLIPVLLLTGITIYFIIRVLSKIQIPDFLKKSLAPAVTITLILFLAWKQPPIMKAADNGYYISNLEMDSTRTMMARDYPDYTQINNYTLSLNKYSALKFGDVYTKNKMLPYLKEVYPDTYFYDYSNNRFQIWDMEIALEDIVGLNGKKLYFVNGPRGEDKIMEMEKRGIPLKTIYSGRLQTIHLLDTIRYNQIHTPKFFSDTSIAIYGGEKITNDGNLFISEKGILYGGSGCRTSEKYRSGKWAFKLDGQKQFALEILLRDHPIGTKYEISVWRTPGNMDAHLVVDDTGTDSFYKAQNGYLTSDKNGWEFLKLSFTVNEEISGKDLKVYLWNKGNQEVYFDDLKITKFTP